ncbi:hypothetical protein PSBY109024_16095 [Pseudoalteromonas byunsanensis]
MKVIPQHLLKLIFGGYSGADHGGSTGGGTGDGIEPPEQ